MSLGDGVDMATDPGLLNTAPVRLALVLDPERSCSETFLRLLAWFVWIGLGFVEDEGVPSTGEGSMGGFD